MAVAVLVPLEAGTMGFLLIAFACTLTPPVAFALAWRRSVRFRERMLRLDLGAVTLFQMARIAGLAWLVLYAEDQLPAVLALWAGGLDMFLALSAVTVAYLVTAMRPFPRRLFQGWHVVGLMDMVVGWTLIILLSPTAAGVLADGATTSEAALEFPMCFIPMAGVPLATCMHFIALLQLRHLGDPLVNPLFHSTEEVARAQSPAAASAPTPAGAAR
jgi:hypothetical protein